MKLSPERNRIIYSDIDCPDIRLRETLPVINQYGVAVHDEPDGTIHHGYIGVATDNTNIRQHFKTLKSTTQADAHRSGMGSTAFKEFLEALGMPIETWRKNIALPNLLPEMRTSPPPLTYTPPSADLKAWRVAHQISQIRGAPALLVLSNGLSPNK